MENKEIKLIGSIDFLDTKVNVYNDPYSDKDTINCSWQARNPDSYYKGVMYINYQTGKVSYPQDAIIPEQTAKDREMLPKFIITGKDIIDDEFELLVSSKLKESYNKRNNIVS